MNWHDFVRARVGELTGDAARDVDIVDELAQRIASRFDELLGKGVGEAQALDLAAIGLHGVMSYLVAHRANEMAVRVALGAGRSHVVRLVLREAASSWDGGSRLGRRSPWPVPTPCDRSYSGWSPATCSQLQRRACCSAR